LLGFAFRFEKGKALVALQRRLQPVHNRQNAGVWGVAWRGREQVERHSGREAEAIDAGEKKTFYRLMCAMLASLSVSLCGAGGTEANPGTFLSRIGRVDLLRSRLFSRGYSLGDSSTCEEKD